MTSEIDNLNRQRNQIFLMTMATKTNTGIKSEKKNLIKKNTWRMSIRKKDSFYKRRGFLSWHMKRESYYMHAKDHLPLLLFFVLLIIIFANMCVQVIQIVV